METSIARSGVFPLELAHACICFRRMQSASMDASASTHTGGMRRIPVRFPRIPRYAWKQITCNLLPWMQSASGAYRRYAWIPLDHICYRRIPPVSMEADCNSPRRLPGPSCIPRYAWKQIASAAYRGMQTVTAGMRRKQIASVHTAVSMEADCMHGSRLHPWKQITSPGPSRVVLQPWLFSVFRRISRSIDRLQLLFVMISRLFEGVDMCAWISMTNR
jgi:hypothetical protein